jgi:hypothetical protein
MGMEQEGVEVEVEVQRVQGRRRRRRIHGDGEGDEEEALPSVCRHSHSKEEEGKRSCGEEDSHGVLRSAFCFFPALFAFFPALFAFYRAFCVLPRFLRFTALFAFFSRAFRVFSRAFCVFARAFCVFPRFSRFFPRFLRFAFCVPLPTAPILAGDLGTPPFYLISLFYFLFCFFGFCSLFFIFLGGGEELSPRKKKRKGELPKKNNA